METFYSAIKTKHAGQLGSGIYGIVLIAYIKYFFILLLMFPQNFRMSTQACEYSYYPYPSTSTIILGRPTYCWYRAKCPDPRMCGAVDKGIDS